MSSNKGNKRVVTPPRTPPHQIGNPNLGITTPTSSSPNYDYNIPRINSLGLNIQELSIQNPDNMSSGRINIPPPPSSPNDYNDENNSSSTNTPKKKKQKKGGMESLINSMDNMKFKEDPNKPRIGILASKNIDLLNTGRGKKAKKSEKKTAPKKGKQHAGKSKTRKNKKRFGGMENERIDPNYGNTPEVHVPILKHYNAESLQIGDVFALSLIHNDVVFYSNAIDVRRYQVTSKHPKEIGEKNNEYVTIEARSINEPLGTNPITKRFTVYVGYDANNTGQINIENIN